MLQLNANISTGWENLSTSAPLDIPDVTTKLGHPVDQLVSTAVKDLMIYVTYVGLCGGISLCGVIANILNIAVFWRIGFTTSITASFFSLSVCDLCVLALFLWAGVCLAPGFSRYSDTTALVSELHLVVGGAQRMIFIRLSVWITAIIAIERCVGILRPHKVKEFFTPRRSALAIATMFVLVSASALPVYSSVQLETGFSRITNSTRLMLTAIPRYRPVWNISIVLAAVLQGFSLLVVLVSNLILLTSYRRRTKLWDTSILAASTSASIPTDFISASIPSQSENHQTDYRPSLTSCVKCRVTSTRQVVPMSADLTLNPQYSLQRVQRKANKAQNMLLTVQTTPVSGPCSVDGPTSSFTTATNTISSSTSHEALKTTDTASCSPRLNPTDMASSSPRLNPTDTASLSPKLNPTDTVSSSPRLKPTDTVSCSPRLNLTDTASCSPRLNPTDMASSSPRLNPTDTASLSPKLNPTDTVSSSPRLNPTDTASCSPRLNPTDMVSSSPRLKPTDTASCSPRYNLADMASSGLKQNNTETTSSSPRLNTTNTASSSPRRNLTKRASYSPRLNPTDTASSSPSLNPTDTASPSPRLSIPNTASPSPRLNTTNTASSSSRLNPTDTVSSAVKLDPIEATDRMEVLAPPASQQNTIDTASSSPRLNPTDTATSSLKFNSTNTASFGMKLNPIKATDRMDALAPPASRQRPRINLHSQSHAVHQNRRLVKLVLILSALALASNIPSIILFLVVTVDGRFGYGGRFRNLIRIVWGLVAVVETLNASLNICLYYRMNSQYRHTLKKMLRWSTRLGVNRVGPVPGSSPARLNNNNSRR
ncbi:DNA-directed RNA polymerase II subunit RPB1-like [Elysia marginata]|uniref:DNA-directed RNA polymerase II subunit RPB1-like n=1 Tax=Elysia marginata TaxID=1093978 RepID=A0AAV4H3M7_9GAST|nr:DNA-directed RNA polymerase II subunit RPB1-like [Elysia marginata]